MKITPYNARKVAIKEQQELETRHAIETVRVHNNFGKRPNYVREAAFDRSNRLGG